MSVFSAQKITENVYWVGAIDWALRNFHGYQTSRGTTYNAFLVLGEKLTLVDTVKGAFYDEMMARIASVVDPSRIEVVVSNHAELDHSGSLPRLRESIKPLQIVASPMGAAALAEHFHWDASVTEVKTGQTLSLGDKSLRFVETRMLHWPDSMFAYLEDEKVLFTNDAFGMHLATSERFTDELDHSLVEWEAKKYYANILMPLSSIVKVLLKKLPSLNLDFEVLAPDHGPLWRKEPHQIIELYDRWATAKPTRKAVVVFDTMWQSTAAMARSIGDGLRHGGASAILMPLEGSHRSDVATEVLDAGAIVVGSPTMNNQLYPTVAEVLTYLKGLRPVGKLGAAFGSHGWSGEATSRIEEQLKEMKVELAAEALRHKYVPTTEVLEQCFAMGARLAEKLAQRVENSGE
ncbi:MAG: FprA family A-type flavoprotein [Myxococcota bacterium]|jgi:flavorubredoxin|nr:FprA family A-type flavoprotein [Myxococcota bacterium]